MATWIIAFNPPPPGDRAYTGQNKNCQDPPETLYSVQRCFRKAPQRPNHERYDRDRSDVYGDVEECTNDGPLSYYASYLEQGYLVDGRKDLVQLCQVALRELIFKSSRILLDLFHSGGSGNHGRHWVLCR